MSEQTVSTDLWEARLPEAWVHVPQESEDSTYFESPDGSAGVYFSTWGTRGKSLADVLRDTWAIELRNLPDADSGKWEIVERSETSDGTWIEACAEYLNRADGHRIVSRLLGRDEFYVRLSYHDYDCIDRVKSAELSATILASLTLIAA